MSDNYELSSTPETPPSPSEPAPRADMSGTILWILLVIGIGANGILQATGHMMFGVVAGILTLIVIALLVKRHLDGRQR